MKHRAGALCFRDASKQEVMLCASKSNPDRWSLPGGGIEPGEDASESAIRESLEEMGYLGGDPHYIGEYTHISKSGISVLTKVYSLVMLELHDDWQDKHYKCQRHWFPLSEIASKIPKLPQKMFVEDFVKSRSKKSKE